MGRLIEADNLKRYIIETYHDPIIVCNDEVHFVAEIIDDYPTVEATPKDQYEARLKADLVAMLEEIKDEAKKLRIQKARENVFGREFKIEDYDDIIQSKIDSLKENTDVC